MSGEGVGYSALAERLAGDASGAWAVHFAAAKRRERGEEVVFLTVGDSDFESPSAAVEAAYASLRQGRTRYSAILGEPALRRAVAERHARLTGRATDPGQVVIAAGAQNALFNVALLLLGPGDEVIVPEPYYVTYPGVAAAAGARLVTVPSPAARGFHFDPAALAAAVTPRTRAVMLATPNNPTGALLDREELEALAEICARHDLWLISDEVYAGLAYERPHLACASHERLAPRTVTIGSLSKTHAMSGWRVGWSVAPADSSLPDKLFRLTLSNTYGIAPFLQDAAVAALAEEPLALSPMVAAYGARARRLTARLDGHAGLACRPPEGGMFLLLDVRGLGVAPHDFAMSLLAERAVALLPADAFGPSAQGYVRINLGTPDAVLDQAAEAIAAHAEMLAAKGRVRAAV